MSEIQIIREDTVQNGIFCHGCIENNKTRSQWGEGEWKNEPDYVHFRYRGLDCVLHRGGMGVWCGYVAVPKGHPAFGKTYDDELLDEITVHGGLTYSDKCQGHICHTGEGEVWWLGFDCGHGMDHMPAYGAIMKMTGQTNPRATFLPGQTYKNREYVTSETCGLVDQLLSMLQKPAETSVMIKHLSRRVQ